MDDFWQRVRDHSPLNERRRQRLEILSRWRNAIAHEDIDAQALGRATVRLRDVRDWRAACRGLAVAFEAVVATQLTTLAGSEPW